MPLAVVCILVYAGLMLAGGVIGYQVSGSKASLMAGATSAVLLAVAFGIAWRGATPAAGLWIASALALLLSVVFVIRLAKTRKFMPAGMLMALSLAATGYFAWAARG
jgi:uncharacterized membrane protein (UPF0136 family)